MKVSRAQLVAASTLRRVCYILIACLFCAVSSGQSTQGEQHQGHAQPTSKGGSNSGCFFFGTSHEAKLGTLAWLLYLDKPHQSGQIFVAPRMVKLSKFELGADGALTFQSLDFVGKYYRFSGSLKSEEIAGEMQLVDIRSGNTIDRWQMNATELRTQKAQANPEQSLPHGRYSNVDYSSEGGDLTGVDIRFFSTSAGTKGMIVFYESYWGEPTFTPFAFSRVEASKGMIRFERKTPSGVARYHFLPTLTGGLFNRDDVAHEKGEKDVVLKRSRSGL